MRKQEVEFGGNSAGSGQFITERAGVFPKACSPAPGDARSHVAVIAESVSHLC